MRNDRVTAIYAEYNAAVKELGPYFTREQFEHHTQASENHGALLNLLDGNGPA